MNTLDEIMARRKRTLKTIKNILHQTMLEIKSPTTLSDETCDGFFRPDIEWAHCLLVINYEDIYCVVGKRGIELSWDHLHYLFVEWEDSMTHQEVCFWAINEAVRKKHGQE